MEGYDASVKFDMFVFYMQFKRPHGYDDGSRSPVVLERKKHSLPVKPMSLFFKLHQSDGGVPATIGNHQHNALFRLWRTQKQCTAYVCPLFLYQAVYEANMHLGPVETLVTWLGRENLFRLRPVEIVLFGQGASVRVGDVPLFKHHVTIPPHDEVDEQVHRYSFSEKALHELQA